MDSRYQTCMNTGRLLKAQRALSGNKEHTAQTKETEKQIQCMMHSQKTGTVDH